MPELAMGFVWLSVYFIIAATTALVCRRFFKIPDELFRKILHLILLGSLAVWVFVYQTWWIAVIAVIIFEVLVYPILILFEKRKGYSEFVTERKKGELKASLLLVFTMFAVVISICWGWLGDKILALACVFAWGFGDAVAALIGKKFGKHKITWKYADGKKSLVDGCVSIALAAVALFPTSLAAYYLDVVGSVVVAVYLVYCGIKTLLERFAKA